MSLLTPRSRARAGTTPHALLPALNGLLSSLLIPITLSSLSLATPSLLLTILEALLETRFQQVSQEVRSSWERRHRTEVTEVLVEGIAEVLERASEEEASKLRKVEVSAVVKGREEGIAVLVEGLLGIARRMGLIEKEASIVHDDVETLSHASTPTPTPRRPSPAAAQRRDPSPSIPRTSTPPPRSTSSLSTSSRISLVQAVALSPPLSPQPVTPRRTLLANGLAATSLPPPRRDRPPLFVPPSPVMMTGKVEGVVRPTPWRGVSRAEVDDLFGPNGAGAEVEEERRRRKGKGKEKTREEEEEACQCGTSVAGEHDEGVCTCAEEGDLPEALTAPHARKHKSKHHSSRRPHQHHHHHSSDSDPAPPPPPPPPRRHRHPRSLSASAPPHPHPHPHSRVQIHHTHSGYLSVVGESEVEAFERARRAKARREERGRSRSVELAPPGGDAEVKLEPPDGWSWVRVEDPGIGITSPSRRRTKRPEEKQPETPSPYTLLLLSQRARLAEKLRDLKLSQREKERGKAYLEETTAAEETEGERVVLRRRVERVGEGWWREGEGESTVV